MRKHPRFFTLGGVAFLHDICMAALSFMIALWLRLGENFDESIPYFFLGTALFTVISALVFVWMRLYRGIWHFASMEDLLSITKAVSLSILLFSAAMFFVHRLEGLPRSVPLINWMLLVVMLGFPRFAYRLYKDRGLSIAFTHDRRALPILIIGFDSNTDLFLRDVLRDRNSIYEVVGIIDIATETSHKTLHGVPVYGGISALKAVIGKLARKNKKPQKIVLSSSFDADILENCIKIADEQGLSLSKLPRMQTLGSASTTTNFRPIDVEDLLGRTQNVHDVTQMHKFIAEKTVLVTGAGGSIGSELCRQILTFSPKQIVLLDNNEYALYRIDQQVSGVVKKAVLADVKNSHELEKIFLETKPQIVFHAAALKHVPLSEQNPMQAIATNVFGTENVCNAAIKHQAEAFVLISTDKAVNPTNIMGASKCLAEKIVASKKSENIKTKFVTVRFGNVLGSAGSVVPLFQEQLANGGPLTVTHKDMTRYFMTIKEASQLVIRAASLEGDNMLYVLDMGTPMKIVELARNMIRLSGLIPDKDIKIEFTGLRAGEKLYEELFYPNEKPKPTQAKGVLCGQATSTQPLFEEKLASLYTYCKQSAETTALAQFRQLVPEYKPL